MPLPAAPPPPHRPGGGSPYSSRARATDAGADASARARSPSGSSARRRSSAPRESASASAPAPGSPAAAGRACSTKANSNTAAAVGPPGRARAIASRPPGLFSSDAREGGGLPGRGVEAAPGRSPHGRRERGAPLPAPALLPRSLLLDPPSPAGQPSCPVGLAEAGAPERGGGARARARARARTGARRGPRGAAGGGPRPLQLELEQARVGEDERRGQEREERPEGGARGGGLPPPVEHRRGERPRQPGAPARRRLQEIRRRRAPAQGRGELGGPELLREALQEPRQEGAERRQ